MQNWTLWQGCPANVDKSVQLYCKRRMFIKCSLGSRHTPMAFQGSVRMNRKLIKSSLDDVYTTRVLPISRVTRKPVLKPVPPAKAPVHQQRLIRAFDTRLELLWASTNFWQSIEQILMILIILRYAQLNQITDFPATRLIYKATRLPLLISVVNLGKLDSFTVCKSNSCVRLLVSEQTLRFDLNPRIYLTDSWILDEKKKVVFELRFCELLWVVIQ